MSHGLTSQDTMVSAEGKLPWHGLGYVSEKDHIKSPEITKEAGLDWQVFQVPAYMKLGDRFIEVPGVFHNVRDDINTVVGTVGERYVPFQNADAPVFLDSLVDSGDLEYVTAGSLWAGKQAWWCARLPEEVTVGGMEMEKYRTYLLLANSHDGSKAITVSVVTVRVVCANTLAFALGGAARTTKIRHTKSAKDAWGEARRSLDIAFKYSTEMAQFNEGLLSTEWNEEEFQSFLNELVPVPEAESKDKAGRARTVAMNTQSTIKNIYDTTENLKHLPYGPYRAVQAVADYNDHYAVRRETKNSTTNESRFASIVAGQGWTPKAVKIVTGKKPEAVAV